MAPRNNNISIGGALVYKEGRSKRSYWIVTDKEGNWEIPKVTVRRGESSVRSVIRMTGESAGMNARVLEEVGRHTSMVVVNGKPVSQRIYYYLMILKSAGEVLGFEKYQWMDAKKAIKQIELKREKEVIKAAEDLLKKWEKERKIIK